jgi:hypothetical protein
MLAIVLEVCKVLRGHDDATDFVSKDHDEEGGGRTPRAVPGQLPPIRTKFSEDRKIGSSDGSSVVHTPFATPSAREVVQRKSYAGGGQSTGGCNEV